MPLPIAHSLLSTSVFVASSGRLRLRDNYRLLALFIFVGLFPDADFITLPFFGFGLHRGLSHSLFFTTAASMAIYAAARPWMRDTPARLWLYLAVAMGLHPICDFFTPDLLETRGGVMLFYPLSSAYYESPWPVFMGIELRYLYTIFSFHTIVALIHETIVAGSVLLAVIFIKRGTVAASRRRGSGEGRPAVPITTCERGGDE
ncbi:MAG: metal-dependent hydrolase [Thermodesulfobacteriota bacterium]